MNGQIKNAMYKIGCPEERESPGRRIEPIAGNSSIRFIRMAGDVEQDLFVTQSG
jgi:hypothetical protein